MIESIEISFIMGQKRSKEVLKIFSQDQTFKWLLKKAK